MLICIRLVSRPLTNIFCSIANIACYQAVIMHRSRLICFIIMSRSDVLAQLACLLAWIVTKISIQEDMNKVFR